MNDVLVRHHVGADGSVHTITLDSPPGNVIDIALCGQLRRAIESAADFKAGKVLVLRGAGRHFSFGASVEEHLPETAAEMLDAVGGVIRDLVRFPYPTVVGIQGSCLGGGLELALACGIIIAEEGATLASPEIQLGVLAPVATALLSGRAAEDLLLTGRSVSGEEAHRLGIVNVLASNGDLDGAVDAFVNEHFVPRSAAALRMATMAIRGRDQAIIEARLEAAEKLYLEEVLPSHDGVEGIKAFMEKRQPVWSNS